MKRSKLIISGLICLGLMFIFSACTDKVEKNVGFVTFGANYHIINCPTTVTIFLDGKNLGTLQNFVDSIIGCGKSENLTKSISVGEHTYKVEIRPISGVGCTKDVTGTFKVSEYECKKVFIDYNQIFGAQSNCDQDAIISKDEYENAPKDPFAITNMEINGNCLKIRFSASGCSGSTWNVKLICSGIPVTAVYPQQMTLRLSLENKEICAAVIGKEISFNIENLQIQGANKVQLNISGNSILYEY